MRSLILLAFLLSTIITFILQLYGTSFVCGMSGVLLGNVFKHFDEQLPDDYWDVLDEINTQDADIDYED